MAKRRTFVQFSLAVGIMAVSGCAGGGSGPDGGEYCNSDPTCDDGFECTIDTCGADNLCRHVEIDERCGAGEVCESGRGCVTSASCDTDEECDDSIACTVDSCGAGNICNHIAVNERCGAGETCDRSMGCVGPTGCTTDAECDDGVACTRDVCTAGGTCSHNALNELCDTGAGERCHQTRGCYAPMPCDTAADCDDGDFCNGAEICTPEFGCEPAPTTRVCDDSDACTVDSCDPTAGTGGMCVFACDSSRPECGCPLPSDCSGRFMISPALMYACPGDSLGGLICPMNVAGYDMTDATFAMEPGLLVITPTRVWSQGISMGQLEDRESPVCPEFDALFENPGGCIERYRLQGAFTDADHFTATFTREYIDSDGASCGLCGCDTAPTSFSVTGTRIP